MKAVTTNIRGILGEAKQSDIENKKATATAQIKNLMDQRRKIQNEMGVLSRIQSVANSLASNMDSVKSRMDDAKRVKLDKASIGPTANARINALNTSIIETVHMSNNQSIVFRKQALLCDTDMETMTARIKEIDIQITNYKKEISQLDQDARQLKKNGISGIREQQVQDGIDSLKNNQ